MKACILDTNVILPFLLATYVERNPLAFTEREITDCLNSLLNTEYQYLQVGDFRFISKGYSPLNTSPFCLHEIEHILQRQFKSSPFREVLQSELHRTIINILPEFDSLYNGFLRLLNNNKEGGYLPSEKQIREFGYSDMNIATIAFDYQLPIITMDDKLYKYLQSNNIDVISMHEI